MKRVLFVCLGNICRSPAAEAVFNKLIIEAELTKTIACESAGTAAYHVGHMPDGRMMRAGIQRGLEFNTKAQKLKEKHFKEFDFIVTMDNSNFLNAKSLQHTVSDSKASLVKMTDYLKEQSAAEIPDPYYGGEDGFEHVLDLLEEACLNLLKTLKDS